MLAGDIDAVDADLGYGLVMPETPCDSLAAGSAGLVAFLGLSGFAGLAGFVDLTFNSASTHDSCVALPAAVLAVVIVLVMPVTPCVELMSSCNVAGLSLCMVPNMFIQVQLVVTSPSVRRCQTPCKPNAYHTLQLTCHDAVGLCAVYSKLFHFSDGCKSAFL